MKKNINKIVAIGIGLSILSGSISPVFAAENNLSSTNVQMLDTRDNFINVQATNQKPVLTLKKAIDAAINNSNKLSLKSKEIKMYRDKMKLQEKINDFYDSIDQPVYDFPYDKLELQEKQTDQAKEFMEDQIANDITNKYNAIVLKEIDINKSKRDLEIKIKDLNFMKTKIEVGMATDNQMTDTQIQIKDLQNQIKEKENTLKNNKDYFKVLTELNLEEYSLDENIEYKIFRINGSVDDYIDKKMDKYFKYSDEMLKLTKDYLNDLKDDNINKIPDKPSVSKPKAEDYVALDTTDSITKIATNTSGGKVIDGAYAAKLLEYQQAQQKYLTLLNANGSYLDGKYSMQESEVKLDEAKKNLKSGLKDCYSTLLALENKINIVNDQIKSTNTKLRFAKSQVDIGMMTENDYKAQVIKSEDLDTGLRTLINNYNNLIDNIEKPWIISSTK
ncbi:multidrug transporter [Clostridium gelidum]|uniref:Multidrug transporter n=1 Tax=Clostridium gelidum TaxID=704125 RepID=A0ABN6IYW7_9CLOT|nr:hypothetical protein [Clostridium gelidum]BCZ47172.1 multidrug transporter [Clostridium gelidum]